MTTQTTLRVHSASHEASILRAALAAAEADRDRWHAIANERLRGLRVSRAVLQRVLTDVAAQQAGVLCDSPKTHKLSFLGRLAHAGGVLAGCGRSVVVDGAVLIGMVVGGVVWRLTHL